jgi:hypothetical protein
MDLYKYFGFLAAPCFLFGFLLVGMANFDQPMGILGSGLVGYGFAVGYLKLEQLADLLSEKPGEKPLSPR